MLLALKALDLWKWQYILIDRIPNLGQRRYKSSIPSLVKKENSFLPPLSEGSLQRKDLSIALLNSKQKKFWRKEDYIQLLSKNQTTL